MRARKRVVTSSGAAAARPVRPKRTPTVRRIKPAIVPLDRSRLRAAALPAAAKPGLPEPTAHADDIDLSVNLGRGLVLRNPLVAASGPFGYGVEVADLVDFTRIGALVTRSTTLRPNAGNSSARPRIVEVPGGILNGVGLQNPGIDAVLERYSATWAGWRVPVIVSVAGGSVGEVVAVVDRLEGEPGVAGIELNLSSPIVARGGLLFGLDADSAGGLVAAVRRASDLPLVAKLAPGAPDIRAVARSVVEAGADAIAAINSVPAFGLADGRTGPAFGSTYGGLSGPAIRPIGLRAVFEIAQAVDVPVIGSGGVVGLGDVLDYLAVGASAVGVATAALAEPALPARLALALAAHCQALGFDTVTPLIGTAQPRRRSPGSTKGAAYRP